MDARGATAAARARRDARGGTRRGARGNAETRARERRTGKDPRERGENRERRRHRAATRVERTRARVQVMDLGRALCARHARCGLLMTMNISAKRRRVAPDRRGVRRGARHTATRESIRPPPTSLRPRRRRRDCLPSHSLSSRARFPRRLVVRSRPSRHPTTAGMVDQAKLSEFLGVTGCDDPAKARFFLESANGDLGAAVSAFYEHGDAPTEASDPSPPSAPPRPPRLDPRARVPPPPPPRAPRPRAPPPAPRPTYAVSAISAAATTTTISPRSGSPAARSPARWCRIPKSRRRTPRDSSACSTAPEPPAPPRATPRISTRAAARGPAPSPARDAPSDPQPEGQRTRPPPRAPPRAPPPPPRPRRPPPRRTPSSSGPTGSPSTTDPFARTTTRRTSRSCSPWARDSALASFSPRIPTRPSTSTS